METILTKVTSYGKRLNGKQGITGILTASLTKNQFGKHLKNDINAVFEFLTDDLETLCKLHRLNDTTYKIEWYDNSYGNSSLYHYYREVFSVIHSQVSLKNIKLNN